jgi:uncharacterized protein YndB with AHSA1/START domain
LEVPATVSLVKPITKQPDSWLDVASERCEASVEMVATPDRIWEVLADHESWPEWFTAVNTVTVTGASTGMGAERRVTLPGMVIDEEFVAWDEGERFAFTVVALSRPVFESLNERVTIEDLGDGLSRVTYVQAFEPKPWFRLPFKLIKPQFRRGLQWGLKGLTQRVE